MAEETTYDPKVAKIIKKLPTGWQEEADAMDEKALRNVIVESTNNIEVEIEKMETNTKYQSLKLAFKEAGDGVREAKKAQKAKIQYALHCLEGMGKI